MPSWLNTFYNEDLEILSIFDARTSLLFLAQDRTIMCFFEGDQRGVVRLLQG